MLRVVCCVCFFGFFRLGELIPASETADDASRHVQLSNLAADCPHRPTVLSKHLRRAKTDQVGKGATIYICRYDSDLCLATALLAWVAARGQQPGPLFRWRDGSPLTKPWVIQKLREALAAIGLDPALGRWSSSAFLSYIRLTPQELAALSHEHYIHPRAVLVDSIRREDINL